MSHDSPWMDVKALQAYLRKPSVMATRHWIRRSGIPTATLSRTVLVHRKNVDRILAGLSPLPLQSVIDR